MSAIKDIEADIVARLQAQISGVTIKAFPEKPEQFKFIQKSSAILVSYAGSRFGPNQSGALAVQQRTWEWDITVLVRHLRQHQGAYDLLDSVRSVLAGYSPLSEGVLYPIREMFMGEENGIWTYIVRMAMDGFYKDA